jgi:hypothetical protein
VKSTFSSLKDVPDEEIVLLSILPGYNWHGLIEISTDAWEELRDSVSYVKVVLNAGESPVYPEDAPTVIDRLLLSEREPLEDNNQAGVNSNQP